MSSDLYSDEGRRGALKETVRTAEVYLERGPERRFSGEVHLFTSLGDFVSTAGQSNHNLPQHIEFEMFCIAYFIIGSMLDE